MSKKSSYKAKPSVGIKLILTKECRTILHVTNVIWLSYYLFKNSFVYDTF